MPDVVNASAIRLSDSWNPLTAEHNAMPVGEWHERAICTGCGTILSWVPGPVLVTHWTDDVPPVTDWERIAEGYYSGPPDDPIRHRFYHWTPGSPDPNDQGQDHTDEQSATDEAPKKRPADISPAAVAKGRSKDTPSRSPEARHDEYVRGKQRARAAARV